MKNFNGRVLFLDRSDINTDEIIPAKYLTEISKEALAPHLLEDLELEGFTPGKDTEGISIIVTRENFGSGSSREHAPWALEMNGINMVVAVNFARIFRQNMFNGGMLAVELDPETIEELFQAFAGTECTGKTDFEKGTITFHTENGPAGSAVERTVSFDLYDFQRELIRAGGWVEYADSRY
ncbi:MAG: 3-isopropylmalate dehydratase small subunit [Spirochaetales bacterium]|nr:3-isopropylmalate dehydratase small subunit [Spirochaetales bacterium]MCF7938082.1 3-isopropylmalate dehydratase small subunit [Spirochaetales bacterium]